MQVSDNLSQKSISSSSTLEICHQSTTENLSRKRKNEDEVSEIFHKTLMEDHEQPSASKKNKSIAPVLKKQFNFIYDQYTEARGEPKMLEISCAKCNTWFMDYQKDGPGRLLRCYADRIYHPQALRKKTFTRNELSNVDSLICEKCNTVLAMPIIYTRQKPKPELRPAYKICTIISHGKQQPSIILKERIK